MEGAAAGHAAHRENLQFLHFSAQNRLRLMPVDLGFLSPAITLRTHGKLLFPHNDPSLGCSRSVSLAFGRDRVGDRLPDHPLVHAMFILALFCNPVSLSKTDRTGFLRGG